MSHKCFGLWFAAMYVLDKRSQLVTQMKFIAKIGKYTNIPQNFQGLVSSVAGSWVWFQPLTESLRLILRSCFYQSVHDYCVCKWGIVAVVLKIKCMSKDKIQ